MIGLKMEKIVDKLAHQCGIEPSLALYTYSRALVTGVNALWFDQVQLETDWFKAEDMLAYVEKELSTE